MSLREIDIEELVEVRSISLTLIDVREVHEFEEARVPGALNIPLAELPTRVAEIPRGQDVYLICAAGARSMRAAQYLDGLGYSTVNVAGGTKAWVEAGLEFDAGPPQP